MSSIEARVTRLEAAEPQPPPPPTEEDRERIRERLRRRFDGIAERLGPEDPPLDPAEVSRRLTALRDFVATRTKAYLTRHPGTPSP